MYVLQHSEGLDADGIYGPRTAACLSGSVPPPCFASGPIQVLSVLAQVPYLSQRDNAHKPHSTCNVTALAMALSFLGKGPKEAAKQFEDELYELLQSPRCLSHYREQNPDLFDKEVPANQVYDNLVWAAKEHGVAASFSGKRSFADIAEQIEQGRPVILSTTLTDSGHVVLLCGLTGTMDLVCHDPYGDFHGGYKNPDGAFRILPHRFVKERLKEVDGPEKWALFF